MEINKIDSENEFLTWGGGGYESYSFFEQSKQPVGEIELNYSRAAFLTLLSENEIEYIYNVTKL